jgi:hypothetical protein
MFKTLRISLLLVILVFVALSSWLTKVRSTGWNNSLWVKVYPINADGSETTARYIRGLAVDDFVDIEAFVARETERHGRSVRRPVRMELGDEIIEQPPALPEQPGTLDIMLWSLRLRWWASSVTDSQDDPDPDVRIFVRYHDANGQFGLDNSVGLQKGMVGIVNAYAGRRHQGTNNVVIAHEFLHTLGATDKYEPGSGIPVYPAGFAEPDRSPLYPQRFAEIMGGRIAVSEFDAMVPKNLKYALIGETTAREIRMAR